MTVCNRMILVTAILATATIVGCGDGRNLTYVHGRVSFDGRKPPQPGMIIFLPTEMPATVKDMGSDPRPGRAMFDADGHFEASTFRIADGLRPGSYDAQVICETAPDDPRTNTVPVSRVPAGFRPPQLVVPQGARSVEFNIDVVAPRK